MWGLIFKDFHTPTEWICCVLGGNYSILRE
ncbi:uncharacterized protein METZ01_LOCUS306606, partial [marine metagenome]